MSYQENITDLINKIAKNMLPANAASLVEGENYLSAREQGHNLLLKLNTQALMALHTSKENDDVSVRDHLFRLLEVIHELNGTERPAESQEGVLGVEFIVPDTLTSVTKLKKIYRDQEVDKTANEIRLNQHQVNATRFMSQDFITPATLDLKEPVLRIQLVETLGQQEGKLALAELDKKLNTPVTRGR